MQDSDISVLHVKAVKMYYVQRCICATDLNRIISCWPPGRVQANARNRCIVPLQPLCRRQLCFTACCIREQVCMEISVWLSKQ